MVALRDHQLRIILPIGLTERMAVKIVLVNASGRTTVVPQVQIVMPEQSMTCTLEPSRKTLQTKSKTLQVRDICHLVEKQGFPINWRYYMASSASGQDKSNPAL